MLNNKKIKIFIFSGPGGVGKTTILKKLFRKNFIREKFLWAVTFTTRKKRPNEKEAKDYFFVSKKEFLILKKKKFFLESQKVLNEYYGTPYFFYQKAKKEKKHLILCIDVKGGIYLKKNFKKNKIINIFIYPKKANILIKRLKERIENKKIIEEKLNLAKKEFSLAEKYYEYFVLNDKLKDTLKILEAIFLAEDLRRER